MNVENFYKDLLSSYDLDIKSYEYDLEMIINNNNMSYIEKIGLFKKTINEITIINLSKQIVHGYFDFNDNQKKGENNDFK
ncbi:MAG: hypothetical protein ACOC33_00455 [bacterium]